MIVVAYPIPKKPRAKITNNDNYKAIKEPIIKISVMKWRGSFSN